MGAPPLFKRRRVYPPTPPAWGGPSNFGKQETDYATKAVGITAIGAFGIPLAPRIVSPVTVAPPDGLDVALCDDRHPGGVWHQGKAARTAAASQDHHSSEGKVARTHGVFIPGGR
jgi:hypothetical protein